MREAASEFTPCGDAFGLDQALTLADQLAGHVIEAASEDSDFIATTLADTRLPVPAGYFFSGTRELFDGT